MFDKEMVLESLHNISNALRKIQERTAPIKCADDFVSSPGGTLRLDAVCMNLIALGEDVGITSAGRDDSGANLNFAIDLVLLMNKYHH